MSLTDDPQSATKCMRIQISKCQARAIAKWAARIPEVSEVFLFGSRAKGTAKNDSDIDLAIVVRAESDAAAKFTYDLNWLDWVDGLDEAIQPALEIDLLNLRSDTPRTAAAVSDHGILLFRRA